MSRSWAQCPLKVSPRASAEEASGWAWPAASMSEEEEANPVELKDVAGLGSALRMVSRQIARRAESELARLAPARGSQGFWGKILRLGSARREILSSPGKKITKNSKI